MSNYNASTIPQYQIPFPFVLLDDGEVLVGQYLQCHTCSTVFRAYVNMTRVKDDYLQNSSCVICNGLEVKVVTYDEV